MKMSKTHFELIAAAVRDASAPYSEGRETRRNIAESLADALATTNPRFDREKFLAACGVQS